MKKAILLILTLLYAAKLFSYECRVSKDANLYGNYYPFKVSDRIGIIKEGSIVYFDSMQLTTYNIDGEEDYLNASYSYYLYVTTESGKRGYISLLDLSNIKNVTVVKVLGSGQPAINIVLSEEKKFWVLNSSEFFAQNDGTIERDCEIKAYSENPCVYECAAIKTTDELRKTILDIENDEYTDCNGNIYYKAKSRTSSFFVTEKDKNDCFKKCFDWDEWFFSYEPSDENSIRSENTSLTRQLIEWYETKRKKYGWPTIELSHWWGLRPHLKWKSLKLLYDGKKDVQVVEQMLIEYRKCICKHPIEWDASVIEKLYDAKQDKKTDLKTIRTEHIDYLKSVAEVTDIWKDGLSEAFKTNSLFFANPLYFISHLEKCGVFEFNPYAGKKYSEIYSDDSMPKIVGNNIAENGDSVVVDNPGFAPVWAERGGRNPNINGYACVTGFFNQDYLSIKSGDGYPYERRFNVFNHEGLDFRGSIGIEIKSFIYGKVIAYGTYETYGRTIFIRNKDCTGIFLLAHLSEFNKTILDSGNIAPGDVVGKVGTSGSIKKNEQGIEKIDGCYEAHLHISYFIINSSEEAANSFVTYNGENSFGKKIEKGSTFKNRVLGNPLNYNSKRKDNVSKTKEEIELWDNTHK